MNALCVCLCVKSTIHDSSQTVNSDNQVCALQGQPVLAETSILQDALRLETCIPIPFLWLTLACSRLPELGCISLK